MSTHKTLSSFLRSFVGAAAVLSLTWPAFAHAQARPAQTPAPACSVAGNVTDASGAALPGVIVALSTTGLSVVTDSQGRYCMPPLRAGEYVLELALQGFSSARKTVTVDATPTKAIEADVVLAVGGFREETVVTATRTRQGLDRVPVRTEVIRRADIEATSARTLADAVEFTNGVRVESNCQNCNFSQIRLLGLQGPYTQILFDGQPTFSSLASVYGIEQIPAGLVERIEVVKGGGSALYGPGSVGGVINVISREPSKNSLNGEMRMESRQGLAGMQFNGGANWVAKDRQTSLIAFAQRDATRPIDVDGDGFTEIARRELASGGARFTRYALTGRAKATFEGTLFTENRRGGNRLDFAPHEADIAEAIETRRIAGSASWYHSVNTAWDYRTTFSSAVTDRDSYYGAGRNPNAYGTTGNVLFLGDVQVNRYWNRHTLSAGVMAADERLDDRQPAYGREIDVRYRNVGGYVQDDWTIGSNVQLVSGLRIDHHSTIDHAIASPRFALRWSPRENLDFRSSFARGFRAPQAFDEDLHLTSIAGSAVLIRQSPDLREETSLNLLTGAEWKPHLWGGQALLEFNLFSTRLDDLFFNINNPKPLTQSLEFLKVNLGTAHVYGTELNLGWGLGEQFILQGGVVVQRARLGEAEPDFGSRDFFRTPQTYGTASLLWSVRPTTRIFAGTRYTGSMDLPHRAGFIARDVLVSTRRFVTLDVSLNQRVAIGGRGFEVMIGARNLTNAYQDDLDRGAARDSDYVYGPRFPRSVYVALKLGR